MSIFGRACIVYLCCLYRISRKVAKFCFCILVFDANAFPALKKVIQNSGIPQERTLRKHPQLLVPVFCGSSNLGSFVMAHYLGSPREKGLSVRSLYSITHTIHVWYGYLWLIFMVNVGKYMPWMLWVTVSTSPVVGTSCHSPTKVFRDCPEISAVPSATARAAARVMCQRVTVPLLSVLSEPPPVTSTALWFASLTLTAVAELHEDV